MFIIGREQAAVCYVWVRDFLWFNASRHRNNNIFIVAPATNQFQKSLTGHQKFIKVSNILSFSRLFCLEVLNFCKKTCFNKYMLTSASCILVNDWMMQCNIFLTNHPEVEIRAIPNFKAVFWSIFFNCLGKKFLKIAHHSQDCGALPIIIILFLSTETF